MAFSAALASFPPLQTTVLPSRVFASHVFARSTATRSARPFHHATSLAMKGARVTSWGSAPVYADLPELPAPSPTQLRLRVLAAGVPRVVRFRAARKHPTAFDQSLPFDPSLDGVGRDEATGATYCIGSGAAPVFSEYANVERQQLVPLPPGADPVAVAALVNATQASWAAFRCRALGGLSGRTVAILGATSNSGRCAAQVAHILGAQTVVGLSRDPKTLALVDGLDERVVLSDPLVLPTTLGPLHIILDFVGGPAAVQLMQAAEADPEDNLQYILAGGLSGSESLTIPGRLINSKPVRIMGSGMGSFTKKDIVKEMPAFVNALCSIEKPPFDVLAVPLSEVQSVWTSKDAKTKRLVLLP